jgi:RNA polymerase sigma-70 factor (TIGR02960 family)
VSQSTLERARAGDEQAFRDLTAPHLRELHVHCYRMLGSLVDADDLLQETLIAAWRGLAGFSGRSSLRVWLYSIATHRCLNSIRNLRRRRPPEPVPPFYPPEPSRRGEVTWLQPYPDALLDQAQDPATLSQTRETVRLAFIAALQRLPPRQTAALLLVDVLGFSMAEVATMMETSPTAVKGALQRARASSNHQRITPVDDGAFELGSAAEQDLARRFARAFTDDDLHGVVALLTDDAWLAMPPAPHEYHGHAAIVTFLQASATWRGDRRLRLVPTRANGQLAFGYYLGEPNVPAPIPTGVLVLTMVGDQISALTRFLDADLHRRFGLPDALDEAAYESAADFLEA